MVDRYILDKVPVKKHQFLYYIHARLYICTIQGNDHHHASDCITNPVLHIYFMMAQASNLILHNKNHCEKESSAPRDNLTFLGWGDIHRVVLIDLYNIIA